MWHRLTGSLSNLKSDQVLCNAGPLLPSLLYAESREVSFDESSTEVHKKCYFRLWDLHHEELLMPNWRELYNAASAETNPHNLGRLVDKAEAAMFLRLEELPQDPHGAAERGEILDAANALLTLKTEKLGWPDPHDSL